jgi:hypothetical protein
MECCRTPPDQHGLEHNSCEYLTADKDFGELVFRQGLVHSGVLLIRLAGVTRGRKAEIVAEVLRERAGDMHRGFTVVTPGQVRIRRPS